MVVNVRYMVRGSKRANDSLQKFALDDDAFAEGSQRIFSYLREVSRRNFISQSSGEGGKWPGYTGDERLYGIIKKQLIGEKYGTRLLRWAPGMERLFPSLTENRHPDQIAETNGRTIIFGTAVPYASNHQYGQGRGPKWAKEPRVKQRRFLSLTPQMIAEIRRIIASVTGI